MRLASSFAGSVVLQTVTRNGWSCVKPATSVWAGGTTSCADAFPALTWLLLWLLLLPSVLLPLAQLDNPAVLPISGRAALKAKLSCGSGQSGGVLDSWEDDLLASQPNWQESRCGAAFCSTSGGTPCSLLCVCRIWQVAVCIMMSLFLLSLLGRGLATALCTGGASELGCIALSLPCLLHQSTGLASLKSSSMTSWSAAKQQLLARAARCTAARACA